MSVFTKQMGATVLLALSLSACLGPGAKPPDVKFNPSPKERYEITLIIPDPPAPIKVEGRVQFFIKNPDCMPYADRIAGIKPDSTFRVPLVFEQKTETTYIGYFFADALMPEDYYGLGECRWDFTSAMALIHIREIEQYADITRDRVIGQASQLNLCRRPDMGRPSDACFQLDTEPTPENLKHNYTIALKAARN